MRSMISLLLVGVCLGIWAFPAHAARVRRLTLTQLRDKADTIIAGTVRAAATRPGPRGNMVWTDYDIAVEETLLGAPGPQAGEVITVSFAGGQHGARHVGILGVPALETGQRYLLFLLPQDNYPSATVGWAQGIYRFTEVITGAERQTVLMSQHHQPLELDPTGSLFRGSPVAVHGQALQALPVWREALDTSRKAPEPSITDASGQPIPQRPIPPQTSAAPVSDRKFADVDHLRRFLRGELPESISSGR